MKQLDANTLVAYVDGELDIESAKFVEKLLAKDAEASQKAEMFRDSTLLIRAAHNHVIHETVPEKLVDAIMLAMETEVKSKTSGSEAVPQHLVNMILDAPENEAAPVAQPVSISTATESPTPIISLARRRSVAAVAMAATFAAFMLGGGFLLGVYQNGGQQISGGNQVNVISAMDNQWREAAFQEALETRKSESAVIWTDPETGVNGVIIPVKTYRREDGTFCRSFRTVDSNSGPEQPNFGVACRELGPQGRWVKAVEALAGRSVVPKLSF